jgi:peptide/nickel transport system permease protein
MGLDQPLYIQYFRWLSHFLRGNLGTSYRTFRPVLSMVMERIGATLLLTVTATILALLFALPMGTLAAYKPYSLVDYLSSALAFIGASTPVFFAALVFIYIFCARLGILPLGGMYNSSRDRSILSLLIHLILPASTLAINHMGSYIRQTRNSVMEVLGEDYVRTARSKGLREKVVILRHAMRNALIPIVTQVGMSIPFLIGGAVVVEQIFGWPGLGSLMVSSVTARDYPAIMGIASVIAVVVLLANILVDLIYGLIDPRIRYN